MAKSPKTILLRFRQINYLIIFLFCFISLCQVSCSLNEEESSTLYGLDSSYSTSNTVLRVSKEIFNSYNSNRISNISKGAPFTMNTLKREGDILQLNISYSGGCSPHNFEIIWDGNVYTDDPCYMNLLVIHNSNNDSCESLITQTITINLMDLIGDVEYKDSCTYNFFSTYNSSEIPDIFIEGIN